MSQKHYSDPFSITQKISIQNIIKVYNSEPNEKDRQKTLRRESLAHKVIQIPVTILHTSVSYLIHYPNTQNIKLIIRVKD